MPNGEGNRYRFRVTADGNSYTLEARPIRGHGQIFLTDETLVIKSGRSD